MNISCKSQIGPSNIFSLQDQMTDESLDIETEQSFKIHIYKIYSMPLHRCVLSQK